MNKVCDYCWGQIGKPGRHRAHTGCLTRTRNRFCSCDCNPVPIVPPPPDGPGSVWVNRLGALPDTDDGVVRIPIINT